MPFSHASVLIVPVTDQDCALTFYRDVLGFSVYGDNQVAPNSGLDLALGDWLDVPAGSIGGLFLDVDDIEAVSAEMEARGLEFASGIDDTPFGKFHPFVDPDGNQLVLHQAAPGLMD